MLRAHCTQRRLLSGRPYPQPNGFALPLALGASLLLLLSSTSLQLLALQNSTKVAQLQRRHQLEDLLASAAQQQVSALQGAGSGCLLAVEHSQWPLAAEPCGISPAQLQALQQGQLPSGSYRVTAYRPGATSAELELQLSGERPWRAAYRLGLAAPSETPTALQVTALQELGLRGARA